MLLGTLTSPRTRLDVTIQTDVDNGETKTKRIITGIAASLSHLTSLAALTFMTPNERQTVRPLARPLARPTLYGNIPWIWRGGMPGSSHAVCAAAM